MGLVVSPSTFNLVIHQGASLQHTWTWHYGPDEESSVPVDLTSATARAQVRYARTSRHVLLEMTSAGGEISLSAQGVINLHVPGAVTATFPALSFLPAGRNHFWDLEIVWPDGDVCRLLQGRVTISPEVTR